MCEAQIDSRSANGTEVHSTRTIAYLPSPDDVIYYLHM